LVSHTINRQWSGDAPAHAAAVTEMSLRPWSPEEPFIGGDVDSPYLNPWSLVWGLVARLTGWTAYDVLVVAGLANLVLILVAFRLFTRAVGMTDAAAAVGLLSAVVLWGWSPWRWSGFISLNSLGFGLPYPSATCFALMLLLWTATLRYLRHRRWRQLVAIVLLMLFVVLSHPFTAVSTAIGVAAMLVASASSRRDAVVVSAAVVVGGVASLAWPYYSVADAAAGGGLYESVHATFYEPDALARIALLLVAAPALLARGRDNRRDPLVWLFIAGACAYLLGWALGVNSLGRVLPVVVLGPQLALATRLVESASSRDWKVWRVAAAGALVLGVAATLPGLTRAVPAVLLDEQQEASLRFRQPAGADVLAGVVAPGEVVLTPDTMLARALVARGVRVVAPPFIQPLIADAAERSAAVAAYRTMSERARREVVEQYGVDWVMLPSGEVVRPDA
jgi:hypothetical protein